MKHKQYATRLVANGVPAVKQPARVVSAGSLWNYFCSLGSIADAFSNILVLFFQQQLYFVEFQHAGFYYGPLLQNHITGYAGKFIVL